MHTSFLAMLHELQAPVVAGDTSLAVGGRRSSYGGTGEKIWRMPMEQTYFKNLDSSIADMKNTGIGNRYGSAITASLFLKEFVDTSKVGATPNEGHTLRMFHTVAYSSALQICAAHHGLVPRPNSRICAPQLTCCGVLRWSGRMWTLQAQPGGKRKGERLAMVHICWLNGPLLRASEACAEWPDRADSWRTCRY